MSFKQLVECIHLNLSGKCLGIYFHIISVIHVCDDEEEK